MSTTRDGVLLQYHCRTNTGYAILPLERAFFQMALELVGSSNRVFHGYPSLAGGGPTHLPTAYSGVREIDPWAADNRVLEGYADLVRDLKIGMVFAFDMPLRAPILHAFRKGGVSSIISYWGASISSPYPWYLRPLRRIQYLCSRDRPDHFIFESEGKRRGAVQGSMIPVHRTSVCRIGVDLERFADGVAPPQYAYEILGVPADRRIVFFSGHMEERKGVAVLVRAISEIVCKRKRRDVHLVVCGNQPGEEAPFLSIVNDTEAEGYVTFAGYRDDLPKLHRSVYLGVIASTGWDSFTLSAVEMAASGIPLIVSRLPGLEEAVVDGETGLTFPPGDHLALADAIMSLVDNPHLRGRMGGMARQRVENEFTTRHQIEKLVSIARSVWQMPDRM